MSPVDAASTTRKLQIANFAGASMQWWYHRHHNDNKTSSTKL